MINLPVQALNDLNEIREKSLSKESYDWKSVKVPESLHIILKQISVDKKEYIYETIARLLCREIQEETK